MQSDKVNPSQTEETPSQYAHISRSSSAASSRLSSSPRKERKNSKTTKSKNVKDEDAIFFKDELEPPRIIHPQDGCINPDFSGDTHNGVELCGRRRKVVQDILATFDLEMVMDRYRGDSFSRSLSKHKSRKWLFNSMAEDISNWTDSQWNEQFRQKVLEEFEKKQDARERKLADAESQRILKLKLQGIIREEAGRTEQFAMRKTVSEKRYDKRSNKKHQSLFKPNDIETQMDILNRDERETKSSIKSGSADFDSIDGNHGNTDETQNGDDISSLPTYKSQLGRTKVDTSELHPQVKDLYEEEDLQQLYREAENLVKIATRNK